MPDFNFAGDPMRPARRDLEHQIEKGLIAGIASASTSVVVRPGFSLTAKNTPSRPPSPE